MATKGSGGGFSAEEKAAMRQTAAERRRRMTPEQLAQEVLETIARMPDDDRRLAERIHAIVSDVAPRLAPKTYYGMPAWADENGKIVLFFQNASKFKVRYATLGFDTAAALDEGTMWPTAFAVTPSLTEADEKRIADLVRRAVG